MSVRGRRKIVVLGMMTKHPVAGVVWQTMHYLIGFERLGFEVYYVEAGAHQPSSMLPGGAHEDRSIRAAEFLDRVMSRFGLGGRWAFHALHADGRHYGMSREALRDLYGSTELIFNLHGATIPLPEHRATGRLVYLETDPVATQIELYDGVRETEEFLAAHCALFTFGENYGRAGCGLPVSARFRFQPTRQPVVLEFWTGFGGTPGPYFTTIGNWKQSWRRIQYQGEVYHWSKHLEFRKYMDLPLQAGRMFELALSTRGLSDPERQKLERKGWKVRDALSFSTEIDAYRDYIAASRGEFTVAKDQNIRFRSGWFSDRSATYLAAGRPVITQDTGFGDFLPTGEGLFAFGTVEEARSAVEAVCAHFELHSRRAREIAREFFDHRVVLTRLLSDLGVS